MIRRLSVEYRVCRITNLFLLAFGILFLIGRPVNAVPNNEKHLKYVVPPSVSTPARYQLERPFQQGQKCGPNSLFLLLALCGKTVDYETVLAKVPLTSKGSSLESLATVAADFGLRCEARKLTPDELKQVEFPAIIHTFALPGPTTPEERDHFYLIGKRLQDGHGYRVVDPTSATIMTLNDEFIARNFSGYCLLVRNSRRSSFLLATTFWICLGLNVVLFFSRKRMN